MPKTKKTKDKTPQTFVQILSIVLTVAAHAHRQTLLQAAVLAPVAVVLGHLTCLVASAGVPKLFTNRPLKEAFAAFTANGSIVTACWDKVD